MKQHFRDQWGAERGTVAVFFALLLPVIFGFAALVIDLGHGWENRRLLQNCVDGAALAASYELPDAAAAEAAAAQYLQTYDDGFCLRDGFVYDPSTTAPTGTPAGPASITSGVNGADVYAVDVYDNDTTDPYDSLNAVRVTMARGVSTYLAFLGGAGLEMMQVRTHAVAIKGDVIGLKGMEPFSLVACEDDNPQDLTVTEATECDYQGPCPVDLEKLWVRNYVGGIPVFVPLIQGWQYTIKIGDNASGDALLSSGSFQALTLGDPGGAVFRDNVSWGTQEWVGDCYWVETKTGAMAGPTRQGLQDRINRDIAHVPAATMYDQVMNNLGGNHGGHGPDDGDLWDCPRVVFVPLVGNSQGGGHNILQVITFAIMFVEDVPQVGPDRFITARFFNPDHRLMPPTQWNEVGDLDPDSIKPTGIRLVE